MCMGEGFMKKIGLWILAFCVIYSLSYGVTLSKDWAVAEYVQPSGYGVNSMAFDPVAGRLINPNFGSDLSLEMYDKDTGAFVESSTLSGASFGYLAGFGIGISAAGNIYLSDTRKLHKLDDMSDTTVVSVHGTNSFEYPCRRGFHEN